MEPITTLAIQLAILTTLKTTPAELFGTALMLFQNPLTITKNTQLSDLTVATFTGYAPVASQVFGTPYIDFFGNARMDCPSVDFVMTDTAAPQTIYGWALTNTAGSALVFAAAFQVPIPLTLASQGFSVQPTYRYGD